MNNTDALGHMANGTACTPMLLQLGSDISYTHDLHFDATLSAAWGDTGYEHQAQDL
jgi:hypothetical protein